MLFQCYRKPDDGGVSTLIRSTLRMHCRFARPIPYATPFVDIMNAWKTWFQTRMLIHIETTRFILLSLSWFLDKDVQSWARYSWVALDSVHCLAKHGRSCGSTPSRAWLYEQQRTITPKAQRYKAQLPLRDWMLLVPSARWQHLSYATSALAAVVANVF